MPHHPKIVEVGHRGAWLYVSAICYANQYLTDGTITVRQLHTLCHDIDDLDAVADDLVRVGLFHRTDRGFLIHDYHVYQPSAEKVRQTKEAASARMQNHRSRDVREMFSRTNGEQSANTERTSNEVRTNNRRSLPEVHPSQSQSQTQTQTTKRKRSSASTMHERDHAESFDLFWSTYPVKKGKAAARKVWTKIAPDESMTELIVNAVRQQATAWTDPRYVPHPTRWLNEARWDDETIISPSAPNTVANPFLAILQQEENHHESARNDTTTGGLAVALPPDENW